MKEKPAHPVDSGKWLSGLRARLREIAAGYGRLLKSLGFAAAVITLSLGLTAAVSYPLWYLSIRHKRAYAIGVFSAVSLVILLFVFQKIRASLRSGEGVSDFFGRFLRLGGRIAIGLLVFLLVIPIVVLFLRGESLFGALALIPYSLLAGAVLFAGKKAPRSSGSGMGNPPGPS